MLTMKFSKKSLMQMLMSCMFIWLTVACKKKQTADISLPIITVAEPGANDTLSLAAEPEVHLEFTVTDESSLATLTVLLVKNNADTLLFETPAVHGLSVYPYHEHVIPVGITALTPLTARITATDHSGNMANQTINFFVEP